MQSSAAHKSLHYASVDCSELCIGQRAIAARRCDLHGATGMLGGLLDEEAKAARSFPEWSADCPCATVMISLLGRVGNNPSKPSLILAK